MLVGPLFLFTIVSFTFELTSRDRLAVALGAAASIAAGYAYGAAARRFGRGPLQLAIAAAIAAMACAVIGTALEIGGAGRFFLFATVALLIMGFMMHEQRELFGRIEALRPWLDRLPPDVLRAAIDYRRFPVQLNAAHYLTEREPALDLETAYLLATRVRWDGARFQLVH